MSRLLLVFVLSILCIDSTTEAAKWITFDLPPDCVINGIDGQYVVGVRYLLVRAGTAYERNEEHGFVYDGENYEEFYVPGCWHTAAEDIDGEKIVGTCCDDFGDHGFVYENGHFTILNFSSETGTQIFGIDNGGRMVGQCSAGDFVYDNGNLTILSPPSDSQIVAYDIDGTKIVGEYHDSKGIHGFLYEEGHWTILDVPDATRTWVRGIDNGKIVGWYESEYDTETGARHSFIYDGTDWQTIDKPGASWTQATGIDGNRIAGQYWVDIGNTLSLAHFIREPGPDTYGVFVGINAKTKDKSGNDVFFRGGDAAKNLMNTIARTVGWAAKPILLADSAIIATRLEDAIVDCLDKGMDAGDRLILYVACHGGSVQPPADQRYLDEPTFSPGDEYLGLGSTDRAYQLTDDDLTSIFSGLDDINKWIFLDSCHSGGFWNDMQVTSNDYGDLEKLSNIGLLAASTEGGRTHFSNGLPDFGRGLKDAFEVTAAQSRIAPVTLEELRDYVDSYVVQYYVDANLVCREQAFGDPVIFTPDLFNPVCYSSPDFTDSFGGSAEAEPNTTDGSTPTISSVVVCVGSNCFYLTVDPNALPDSNTFIGNTTVSVELNFRAKFTPQVELIVPVNGTWSAWLDPEIVGPGAVTFTLYVKGENLDLTPIPDGNNDVQVAEVILFFSPAS